MKYRVQVYANDANFGPGTLLAEFERTKNLGYADYANDVPEAFFTIDQDDPKVALLRTYEKKAHVKIYRDTDLVWAGALGEYSANYRDAVFYAYGYLSGTFLIVSDWNMVWTNDPIDIIVDDLWTLAKTTRTNSRLKWVTTGTIECPHTTSGGSTDLALPTYKIYYKRILSCYRELAALSIGDTTQRVLFEITPAGVFNFWKNYGTDTSLTYRMGDGMVKEYSEHQSPIARRNDLLTVGINPNSVVMRNEVQDTTDQNDYGRAQDPVFFSWVRDSDELARVGGLRIQRSVRDQYDLSLSFYANTVLPALATGSGWKMTDRVKVMVDRGLTNINALLMVAGYQVIVFNGQERVKMLLQERPGT